MSRQRSLTSRILWAPVQAVRALPKTVLALLVIGALVLNFAMLTITGVYATASAGLSAIGLSTVAAREAGEAALARQAQTEAAEKAAREAAERQLVVRRITAETKQTVRDRARVQAARNTASVFGEAIPFVGIGVIAAALAMEIKDSCDTARDLTALAAAVDADGDPEAARLAAAEAFDCTDLIPNADDLPTQEEILASVRSAPGAAWEKAVVSYGSLSAIDWSEAAADAGVQASAASRWLQEWFGLEPASE